MIVFPLLLHLVFCMCVWRYNPAITDLLVDMLGVLASYSITVKELKFLFSMLQGEGGLWVSDDLIQCVAPWRAFTPICLGGSL